MIVVASRFVLLICIHDMHNTKDGMIMSHNHQDIHTAT